MKQRISAVMLSVQPTFKWLLLLLAGGTGVEYYFFRKAMQAVGNTPYSFEHLLDRAHPEYMLAALFALFSFFFLFSGCERSGKMSYTLRRLPILEKEVHFLWAGYYSLCYLLLAVWQILMLTWFHHLYAVSPLGEGLGSHSLFLATYRNPLFHSLLPLHNLIRWVRNLLLIPALGLCTSFFSWHQRRGKNRFSPILLLAGTLLFFVRRMAEMPMDIYCIIVLLHLTVMTLKDVLWEEKK